MLLILEAVQEKMFGESLPQPLRLENLLPLGPLLSLRQCLPQLLVFYYQLLPLQSASVSYLIEIEESPASRELKLLEKGSPKLKSI